MGVIVCYAFEATKEKTPKRGEGFLTAPCTQSALACSVWGECGAGTITQALSQGAGCAE